MERHPAAEAGEYPGVHDDDGFTHDIPALQCLPLLQAGARRGQEVETQEEVLIFTARFQQEQLHNKLQLQQQKLDKDSVVAMMRRLCFTQTDLTSFAISFLLISGIHGARKGGYLEGRRLRN